MQQLPLPIDEHNRNHSEKKHGACKNHVIPHHGNQPTPDNGSRDKAENGSEIEQGRLRVLLVVRVDICGDFLRAASKVPYAHGRRERVSVQLSERLHLDAARQRRKAVCQQVHILRHKRNAGQEKDFDKHSKLSPVKMTFASHYANDIRHRDADGKRQHRHSILSTLFKRAAGYMNAQQQQIARLRIGEDVIAHKIGVGVHHASRQRQKRRYLNGIRHLQRVFQGNLPADWSRKPWHAHAKKAAQAKAYTANLALLDKNVIAQLPSFIRISQS